MPVPPPSVPAVNDTLKRSGPSRQACRLPKLPCFPCPHRSACCSWGVDLSMEEAAALGRTYGDDKVVLDPEAGVWRTRVVDGRCAFLGDNRCLIHDDPHYPAVCRGFPWTDAETGGPYRGDPEVCPEFVLRPQLKAVLRPDKEGPASGG
jgi:putative zinc- or iron-chelating protein